MHAKKIKGQLSISKPSGILPHQNSVTLQIGSAEAGVICEVEISLEEFGQALFAQSLRP